MPCTGTDITYTFLSQAEDLIYVGAQTQGRQRPSECSPTPLTNISMKRSLFQLFVRIFTRRRRRQRVATRRRPRIAQRERRRRGSDGTRRRGRRAEGGTARTRPRRGERPVFALFDNPVSIQPRSALHSSELSSSSCAIFGSSTLGSGSDMFLIIYDAMHRNRYYLQILIPGRGTDLRRRADAR